MSCNGWPRERPRGVCDCIGFGHRVCLIWWAVSRSPSARDGPQSLHEVESGAGRVEPRTTGVLCFTPAPALSCTARSSKDTWKRRVGEGNSCGANRCSDTSTSTHPSVPSYWCWVPSVRVCSWAARRHPPPELEGADAAVGWWERGVYGESGLRQLCSVVVQGVCVQEGASASHRKP